eukprot:TRINITY_DN3205_c1_g1_i3.p1 TRINITY_DN3205_c1_g1~~TRINITY_DN3205_c1_g1_i3.p1  ORF type:complete len:475 (+),score=54.10 TRINITY_DN3205_c1_g1_i3:302-1726(+)
MSRVGFWMGLVALLFLLLRFLLRQRLARTAVETFFTFPRLEITLFMLALQGSLLAAALAITGGSVVGVAIGICSLIVFGAFVFLCIALAAYPFLLPRRPPSSPIWLARTGTRSSFPPPTFLSRLQRLLSFPFSSSSPSLSSPSPSPSFRRTAWSPAEFVAIPGIRLLTEQYKGTKDAARREAASPTSRIVENPQAPHRLSSNIGTASISFPEPLVLAPGSNYAPNSATIPVASSRLSLRVDQIATTFGQSNARPVRPSETSLLDGYFPRPAQVKTGIREEYVASDDWPTRGGQGRHDSAVNGLQSAVRHSGIQGARGAGAGSKNTAVVIGRQLYFGIGAGIRVAVTLFTGLFSQSQPSAVQIWMLVGMRGSAVATLLLLQPYAATGDFICDLIGTVCDLATAIVSLQFLDSARSAEHSTELAWALVAFQMVAISAHLQYHLMHFITNVMKPLLAHRREARAASASNATVDALRQ